MKTPTLPKRLGKGEAAEINFVVRKFLHLPHKEVVRLSNTIRYSTPDSKSYAEAGIDIFSLLITADNRELTNYMSEQLGVGLSGYLIMPEDYAGKAARLTKYFRDNLSLEWDTIPIDEIDLASL